MRRFSRFGWSSEFLFFPSKIGFLARGKFELLTLRVGEPPIPPDLEMKVWGPVYTGFRLSIDMFLFNEPDVLELIFSSYSRGITGLCTSADTWRLFPDFLNSRGNIFRAWLSLARRNCSLLGLETGASGGVPRLSWERFEDEFPVFRECRGGSEVGGLRCALFLLSEKKILRFISKK